MCFVCVVGCVVFAYVAACYRVCCGLLFVCVICGRVLRVCYVVLLVHSA